MKRFVVGLTAPVLAIGLLTACNGNSDNGSNSADKAPSSSPSASQPASGGPSSPAPTEKAPGAGSKYCTLLSSDLSSLFNNIKGPKDAAKAVDAIKQVAAEAPSKVRDDWKVLDGSLGQVQVALTKAAKLQKEAKAGKVSKKQVQKEMTKLMQQTQSLSTPRSKAAGQAVAKNAADYCGLTLGG
jgi:small-conductance mechanosensitive channel